MQDFLSSVKKNSSSTVALIALILFVLSFALYFQTISHGFVNYDDDWLILENNKIRSLENIVKFFTETTATDYLPLKELSYALNYFFFGNNPAGYHLTDVMLYGLTVVFVFLFLNELSGSFRFSLIASLIFLAHPLHSEVVSWASARKDSLSGLFFFASFYFFVRHLKRDDLKRSSIYIFSLFLFLLALLSKPSVIIAPLLLILMEITFFNKDRKGFLPKGTLKRVMPFIAVSVVFTVITVVIAYDKGVVKEYWEGSPYVTFLTMITVIGDYMRLVFFPFNLCVRYQVDFQNHFLSSGVLVNLIIIVSVLFSAFLSIRKSKWFFFGICWFFAGLLPVLNIIPIAILKADRYIYIPSFGLIIIMAFFLSEFSGLIEKTVNPFFKLTSKSFLYSTTAVIFILLAFLTLNRNGVWKDGMTLWQETIKKSPGDYLVLNNMGTLYKDMKKYDEAEKMFETAISAKPDYYAPYFNLSTLYGIYGDSEKALSYIQKAFELNPDDFKTNINLGNIYRRQGELVKSESAYRRAISIRPDAPEGYYNLAIFYEKEKGFTDEAEKLYRTSIEKDKTFVKSFNNLGNIYFRNGDFEKALLYFEKSLFIDPQHIQTLNNIATIYMEKGDCEKAVNSLKKALLYNSKLKYIIYYNLYKAYQCAGNLKESEKYIRLSLAENPDFEPALNVIGRESGIEDMTPLE